MGRKIEPYKIHEHHHVEIMPTYKANGFYYKCLNCDKFVGWLSKSEVQQAENLGLVTRRRLISARELGI